MHASTRPQIANTDQHYPPDQHFHLDSLQMCQNDRLRGRCQHCQVDLQPQPKPKDPLCHHHNGLRSRSASTTRLLWNRLPYPPADLRHAQMQQRRLQSRGLRDPTSTPSWHRNQSQALLLSVSCVAISLGLIAMLPSSLVNSCLHQMLAILLLCSVTRSHRPQTRRGPSSRGYTTMSTTIPRTFLPVQFNHQHLKKRLPVAWYV